MLQAITHCHQAPLIASANYEWTNIDREREMPALLSHTYTITCRATMDTYPGSELSISQLLHALEGKLDQLAKNSIRYDPFP